MTTGSGQPGHSYVKDNKAREDRSGEGSYKELGVLLWSEV